MSRDESAVPSPASRLRAAAIGVALALLAPFAGADDPAPYKPFFSVSTADELPEPAATFDEVRKLILEHYYLETLSESDLYRAAIDGMLKHVAPPNVRDQTAIIPPAAYARLRRSLESVQVSAGIQSKYDRADESLTVVSVLPRSPAHGLIRPRDRILRIDGRRLANLAPAEVDRMLSGSEGDRVELTVVRDIEVLEFELLLVAFETARVERLTLPDAVDYLQIKRITQGVTEELQAMVESARSRDVSRFIIDLRGNAGGVFKEGLTLAELFIEKPLPLLITRSRGGKLRSYVSSNETPLDVTVVILIDRKTASSAEIFAAAMQAHRKALVVGERSFGKATVERTFSLDNDYRAKFVVGALYAPGGKSWFQRGLQPDLPAKGAQVNRAAHVEIAPSRLLRRDKPLHAAWRVLTGAASAPNGTSE